MEEKEISIPIKNGKLFCQTAGNINTGNPLIVLHGGPGLGCQYLLPQMKALGQFSFAIFYDQRGTGLSVSTDDWYAHPFETYCQDLDTLRKSFNLEKISLLAHSFGNVFAAFYASEFPQHVDKMVFVNSVPLSSQDYLDFVKHRSAIVDQHKSELDAIRQLPDFQQGDSKTIERFYRIYFKNYFAKPHLANTLTLTMTPQAAINNFKIYDMFFDNINKHSFSLYGKLQAIDKSSLIISGDKDVIPLHYMEHLHQSIPSSKYIEIKDCGHFAYIDQPDILFDEVRKFILL